MLFIGVNGTGKKVTKLFIGVNGTPKEASNLFVGQSNRPKPVYSRKPIETVVPSSNIMTVPAGIYKIQVFAVGGGAGGEPCDMYSTSFNHGDDGFENYSYRCGGNGGGAGYTKTQTIAVNPGDKINISIGSGGAGGSQSHFSGTWHKECGISGGATVVTIGNRSVTAGGGYTSGDSPDTNDGITYYSGNGGSGGGKGYVSAHGWSESTHSYTSSKGGVDGSDGGWSLYNGWHVTNEWVKAGQGQHYTTRAFGESNGTLYSQGGDGGKAGDSSRDEGTGYKAEANTGGGGSGTNCCTDNSLMYAPRDGACGMVLMRW